MSIDGLVNIVLSLHKGNEQIGSTKGGHAGQQILLTR